MLADFCAAWIAGNNKPIMIPMIAKTIKISSRVTPRLRSDRSDVRRDAARRCHLVSFGLLRIRVERRSRIQK